MEIPVVTARYQLWFNLKKEGSGDPAQVAKWIDEDADSAYCCGSGFVVDHRACLVEVQ